MVCSSGWVLHHGLSPPCCTWLPCLPCYVCHTVACPHRAVLGMLALLCVSHCGLSPPCCTWPCLPCYVCHTVACPHRAVLGHACPAMCVTLWPVPTVLYLAMLALLCVSHCGLSPPCCTWPCLPCYVCHTVACPHRAVLGHACPAMCVTLWPVPTVLYLAAMLALLCVSHCGLSPPCCTWPCLPCYVGHTVACPHRAVLGHACPAMCVTLWPVPTVLYLAMLALLCVSHCGLSPPCCTWLPCLPCYVCHTVACPHRAVLGHACPAMCVTLWPVSTVLYLAAMLALLCGSHCHTVAAPVIWVSTYSTLHFGLYLLLARISNSHDLNLQRKTPRTRL